MTEKIYVGDCLTLLDRVEPESIDLVYVDPPFYSQAIHQLGTRDGKRTFVFDDLWGNENSYSEFIVKRLQKIHRTLKSSGSVFFHCDRSASHIIRILLERVFGAENFRSEIIWHFRRWSNSKRGLLNSHQTIYFFSKGANFKFNPAYEDYSPATNVDQILQKRVRDHRDKVVYARGKDGEVISSGKKRGVPLSDVWDIPFLNPKAKERVGYPTQKPVVLLQRIVELVTNPRDTVLDPFCGSGTALVAAKMLERKAIGFDISKEAANLARKRLETPVVTRSVLLEKGRSAYATHDRNAAEHLAGIKYVPVHRNRGIDGVLKEDIGGIPVFLRVQRNWETRDEAAGALASASKNKGKCLLVVVATGNDLIAVRGEQDVLFINSTNLSLQDLLKEVKSEQCETLLSAG